MCAFPYLYPSSVCVCVCEKERVCVHVHTYNQALCVSTWCAMLRRSVDISQVRCDLTLVCVCVCVCVYVCVCVCVCVCVHQSGLRTAPPDHILAGCPRFQAVQTGTFHKRKLGCAFQEREQKIPRGCKCVCVCGCV